MKKIVGILGVAAMLVSSVFAADMAARVYMTGNVGGVTIDGENTKGYIWNLTKQDQKDADALKVSVNGDKSGANFQFWYNYDGSGSANLVVRSTNLWFKPVDMVKVIVGDVSESNYKEHIDWWKVAKGDAASAHATWSWSSYSTVEGSGLAIEVTPIDGLSLNVGATAGAGTDWIDIAKNSFSYLAYGAGVQYNFSGSLGLPMSAAISWRDAKKNGEKILAIGAEYGNDFAAGIYAMGNIRLRWDTDAISDLGGSQYTNKALAFKAIAIDNYVKYAVNAFKVQLRAPVTIRGLSKTLVDGKEVVVDDPSWMSYELKASYGLGMCTPYVDIENDNAVRFNDNIANDLLKTTVQVGAALNVGSCALDAGVKVDISSVKTGKVVVTVPFTASVAF